MRKVLIVDDDVDFVSDLQAKLKAKGYDVASETKGGKAVAAADAHQPDVVLLDFYMPDLGGRFFRWLRKASEKTSVILITSMALDSTMLKRAGASGFLQKPFDAEAAAKTIDEVTAHDG